MAKNIAGLTGIANDKAIPSVIYRHPEITIVGKSESDLSLRTGINIEVFHFKRIAALKRATKPMVL